MEQSDEPVAAMPEEHEDSIREEEPNEEWPDELPGGDEERRTTMTLIHVHQNMSKTMKSSPRMIRYTHPRTRRMNRTGRLDLDAPEGGGGVDPALEEACHAEFEACLADEDIDHDGVEREPWPDGELENDPCQEEAERCLDEVGEGDAENFKRSEQRHALTLWTPL